MLFTMKKEAFTSRILLHKTSFSHVCIKKFITKKALLLFIETHYDGKGLLIFLIFIRRSDEMFVCILMCRSVRTVQKCKFSHTSEKDAMKQYASFSSIVLAFTNFSSPPIVRTFYEANEMTRYEILPLKQTLQKTVSGIFQGFSNVLRFLLAVF